MRSAAKIPCISGKGSCGESAANPDAPDAPIPTNGTLEVTPAQAERLATALRMGRLTLSLRPLRRDGDAAPPSGITTDLQVVPTHHSARGAPAGKDNPLAVPPSQGVTIYRWTQPSAVSVPGLKK